MKCEQMAIPAAADILEQPDLLLSRDFKGRVLGHRQSLLGAQLVWSQIDLPESYCLPQYFRVLI